MRFVFTVLAFPIFSRFFSGGFEPFEVRFLGPQKQCLLWVFAIHQSVTFSHAYTIKNSAYYEGIFFRVDFFMASKTVPTMGFLGRQFASFLVGIVSFEAVMWTQKRGQVGTVPNSAENSACYGD